MSRSVKATYTFFLLVFSLGTYFVIQKSVSDMGIDLMMPLDSMIPQIPSFVWVYHSLLPVIVFTSVFVVEQKKNVYSLVLSCIISTIILNIFYIYLPCFYPRAGFELQLTGISEHVLHWTREIDGSNNTFPSGHVTFSWLMFWAIYMSSASNTRKWLIPTYLIWASLVSFSTLALKQHYIVDVLSGMMLASFAYLLSRKIVYNVNNREQHE